MEISAIINDLNRRFSDVRPEFYNRRIIFWYDEDGEFADQIHEIELENAKVVTLTGSNTFTVKKLLCEDDPESNYLVYDLRSVMRDDDNWLINVQLYSEEFRADLNSIWINEMDLIASPVVRKQVKAYNKFFRAKDRREAFSKIAKNVSTAPQMHLAVMATLCGKDSINRKDIIRAVIMAGLNNKENSIYNSFVSYGCDTAFWQLVSQATGYYEFDDPSIERLAVHVLLTATTRTLHPDHLAGLGGYISIPHQAFCYELISEWLHGSDRETLYELARYVEKKAKLRERFSKLTIDDLAGTECFPCINECILTMLMTDISNQIINAGYIRSVVEKRRIMAWSDYMSCYYNSLTQVANMQDFYIEHAAGFHTVEPEKIWKQYTTDYYRMDVYYRMFNIELQKCFKLSHPLLDDLFRRTVDVVEGLYSHWYLGQLGQNWTTASEEALSKMGAVTGVPQQRDFYKRWVKASDIRTFVIISDAFRYEIATSLAEELRRDAQCKVELSSCEGIFPTATKYGMAALLPHNKLETIVNNNGIISVLADGMHTDSGYRDKVLKTANEKSIALKYDNIIGLKRSERQELVKGMQVVYIYHDRVDAASHVSDSSVFPACDEAIDEIKNLIKIITNDFGGTRVLVTADHGFLYTYRELAEDSKVDKTTPSSTDVEVDRRYLITTKGAHPDYLMPIFFRESSELDAYAPRENIRIKKKGGGLNFVHGGASLQEMVVPVLEYQHLRNSSKAYQRNRDEIDTKPVTIQLNAMSRKISNMIVSLNFYQTEEVGGNRSAANYRLYFTDANGKQISDVQKIIADKTSENIQDRTFRCTFNLKNVQYDKHDSYYLVIEDEKEFAVPQRIEFQIDIPFAVDEFNFFD